MVILRKGRGMYYNTKIHRFTFKRSWKISVGVRRYWKRVKEGIKALLEAKTRIQQKKQLEKLKELRPTLAEEFEKIEDVFVETEFYFDYA